MTCELLNSVEGWFGDPKMDIKHFENPIHMTKKL